MQPVEADAAEQQRQQQIKAAIGRGKAEAPLQDEIKKRTAGQDAGKQHIPADSHSGKDAQQRPQLDRHRKGCVRPHRTPAFLKCLRISRLPTMQPKKPISVVNSRIKASQLGEV